MIKGIDCAAPLTAEKARAFKKLGYEFVGRYFCPTGKRYTKRLCKAEADAIIAAGLRILAVYETATDRAKGGMSAGAVDGARAYNQALELGMPKSGIIYFAVDYDAQSADFDAIEAYLRAARQQTGEYEIGVYGSYKVIEAMHARGACKGFWQCFAWSYGKRSEHRNVYQAVGNTVIAGHTVDINECPDMVEAGIWNYEEEEMFTYEQFKEFMQQYEKEVRARPAAAYAEQACQKAIASGLFKDGDGDNMLDEPHAYMKRQEFAVVLDRMGELGK